MIGGPGHPVLVCWGLWTNVKWLCGGIKRSGNGEGREAGLSWTWHGRWVKGTERNPGDISLSERFWGREGGCPGYWEMRGLLWFGFRLILEKSCHACSKKRSHSSKRPTAVASKRHQETGTGSRVEMCKAQRDRRHQQRGRAEFWWLKAEAPLEAQN